MTPKSRRDFLAGAGALALVPSSTFAQQLKVNAATQTPLATEDSASLAARRDDADHMTIEVRINGAGPYRFVVDTGAERSVIADTVATALGLPVQKRIKVNGLSGQIEVVAVAVDNLSFGPFVRNGLTLPVLPRVNLLADGFLGLDAIDGTHVTFDFLNRAVRIDQPRAFSEPEKSADRTYVKASGSGGYLRIMDCRVDSVSAVAFIDTGAQVSVGNVSLKDALAARNKNLIERGRIVLTGVTGGEIIGDVIPISRIRLRDLSFTNGSLAIADVPDFATWHMRYRPSLLIGMDYLRQFASVSIDYRAKDMRFDLSRDLPKPSPGVEISREV